MKPGLFLDRCEVGRVLAAKLVAYAHAPGVVVLALLRGGVPVGYEVARALGAVWRRMSTSTPSRTPAW
jgi:predicted phosphoribosyltransferase